MSSIIFISVADNIKGSGHLARSLGLAIDLKKLDQSLNIIVYNNNSSLTKKLCNGWGFSLATISYEEFSLTDKTLNWFDESELFIKKLSTLKLNFESVLIIDGKYHFNKNALFFLNKFSKVIFFDNPNTINHKNLINVVPTNFFNTKLYGDSVLNGEKWMWLNPKISDYSNHPEKNYDYAIFMGGSDPSNQTLVALKDLETQTKGLVTVLVLKGPLNKEEYKNITISPRIKITLIENNSSIHLELLKCHTCLLAFGLTSIEMDFLGSCNILYTHNKEHENDLLIYLENKSTQNETSRLKWLQGSTHPIKGQPHARANVAKNLFELIS